MVDSLQLHHAKTFTERLLGLHARQRLSGHRGLCIAPCAAVHTFFMAYSIDVVFFDARGGVLRTIEGLTPYRAVWCRAAAFAVELPAGYCAAYPGHADAIRRALSLDQGEGLSSG
jgi:uncharacterized membrane protein (UPF0127 family)